MLQENEREEREMEEREICALFEYIKGSRRGYQTSKGRRGRKSLAASPLGLTPTHHQHLGNGCSLLLVTRESLGYFQAKLVIHFQELSAVTLPVTHHTCSCFSIT